MQENSDVTEFTYKIYVTEFTYKIDVTEFTYKIGPLYLGVCLVLH